MFCSTLKELERRIGLRRDATRAPIQGPEWRGAGLQSTPQELNHKIPPGLRLIGAKAVWTMGVVEIHWGRGLRADNFLTVIYQIDAHCRRLLWVGRRRSQATLRRGLKA